MSAGPFMVNRLLPSQGILEVSQCYIYSKAQSTRRESLLKSQSPLSRILRLGVRKAKALSLKMFRYR